MYLRVREKVRGHRGFPRWFSANNLPAKTGDAGSIPGLDGFPWRRKRQPTPVLFLGKSHGQKSLMGYSLRGRKRVVGHD